MEEIKGCLLYYTSPAADTILAWLPLPGAALYQGTDTDSLLPRHGVFAMPDTALGIFSHLRRAARDRGLRSIMQT